MSKKKSQEEFISKCVSVHGYDLFDYSSSVYLDSKIPIEIICKKHNEKFLQRLDRHLFGNLGCSKCIKERYENSGKWTKEFILQEIKSIVGCDGYADVKKAHPSLTTMALRRFGSWVEACRVAGVKSASDKPIYDICCIEGCNLKVRSSHCKWCETHYYRNRRNGDPEKLQICQYNVNEKIFDEWNDTTAWLIGLLWTDGWMGKSNSVGLHLKDVQLIETAREKLDTDVEIKTRINKKTGKEYKSFSIANKYLADRLRTIGMHVNKTFTIEYPKNMPDEMFGPFFRGVIDGDGTVWLKKRRIGQQVKDCRVSFVSASKVFVEQMQEELKKRNIRFAVAVKKKYLKSGKLCSTWLGKDLWRITICHTRSLRALYEMMYPKEDVPCLHRKRDSFHEWYITPRAMAGNPNFKLGFWTEEKLQQLKHLYLDPNGSIEEMTSIFGCTWEEILWAGSKKLGLKRPCYWTKEEDEILYKYYKDSSWDVILNLLPNRNKNNVFYRASKLKIVRPVKRKKEVPEKETLIDLYEKTNQSMRKIGLIYGCSKATVKNWLDLYEIRIKTKSRDVGTSLIKESFVS